MDARRVSAIVAMDEGRVIGRAGGLPWHLPEDLAHFKKLTTGHVVIMGRKTWESLPPKFRPLPNRVNIVVSRDAASLHLPAGVHGAASLEEALEVGGRIASSEQTLWVIGGAQIYAAALPLCEELHVTVVPGVHDGDATFPEFVGRFAEASRTPGESCSFVVYQRR